MYVPSERPGFCEGKTPTASDQTIKAKTTAQLQLTPIWMPAIRPSLMLGFTVGSLKACGTYRAASAGFGSGLVRGGSRARLGEAPECVHEGAQLQAALGEAVPHPGWAGV